MEHTAKGLRRSKKVANSRAAETQQSANPECLALRGPRDNGDESGNAKRAQKTYRLHLRPWVDLQCCSVCLRAHRPGEASRSSPARSAIRPREGRRSSTAAAMRSPELRLPS